jgi:Mg2+-importing ATPase
VLFVIRTLGRPWTNRPSLALTATVIGVVIVGIALPYTLLAAPFGMKPLPPSFFLLVALMVPSYLTLVELVKGRII